MAVVARQFDDGGADGAGSDDGEFHAYLPPQRFDDVKSLLVSNGSNGGIVSSTAPSSVARRMRALEASSVPSGADIERSVTVDVRRFVNSLEVTARSVLTMWPVRMIDSARDARLRPE